MKVIELNEGRKVVYELRGTKLDFADWHSDHEPCQVPA